MSMRERMQGRGGLSLAVVMGRCVLGLVLVWAGLSKGLDPVGFLKALRAYDLPLSSHMLTGVAALLPWFEVYCGGLLMAGVLVDGAALASFGMLVPFTFLILQRGVELHVSQGIALCAVRFDCGCGTGEVLLCSKVAENLALILLSGCLLKATGFGARRARCHPSSR